MRRLAFPVDFFVFCFVYEYGCVSSQRQSRFERATRSLAMFVRSHRSLRSLAPQRYATLCYARFACLLAPFMGSLTHFGHSLVGQLKFVNMCSRWKRVSWEQSRFLSSVEKRLFSNTFSPRYYVNSLMLCTSYCLSWFFVSSFVLNLHNLVWIHTVYILL